MMISSRSTRRGGQINLSYYIERGSICQSPHPRDFIPGKRHARWVVASKNHRTHFASRPGRQVLANRPSKGPSRVNCASASILQRKE